ncbi:unnamed protein product [Clavelina lepadiformis]|uniref:Fucosyltransferase n=1 Tax=Clavelina lepadiformis TaxID=159417 RepID=A0ABP0FTP6_CLALP
MLPMLPMQMIKKRWRCCYMIAISLTVRAFVVMAAVAMVLFFMTITVDTATKSSPVDNNNRNFMKSTTGNQTQPTITPPLPSKCLILLWAHIAIYVHRIPEHPSCGGGCNITTDRSRYEEADAVVFQMKTTTAGDLPDPRKRKSNQVFVWFTRETPWTSRYFYYKKLTEFDGYFNWTMTYRLDSDVKAVMMPFEVRSFFDNMQEKLQGQAANYFRAGFNSLTSPYKCEKNRLTEDDLRFNLARKKFLAAWAANNRDLTAGAKERFSIVQQLVQSGLKLDIFGKSGKKPKFMNSKQFYDTMSEFKFYFAFENGYHCQEYITEKVWFNSFYLGSVPIVWGPTKTDASRMLPPNSYIYYEDFSDPMELINYLKYLDQNDTAYLEYFAWRLVTPCYYPLHKVNDQKIGTSIFQHVSSWLNGFCELSKLIREGVHRRTSKSISSLKDLWYGRERNECLKEKVV